MKNVRLIFRFLVWKIGCIVEVREYRRRSRFGEIRRNFNV